MARRMVRFAARWVVPIVSPVIRDGAVLVDGDGRIAAVGPAPAVPTPEEAERVDLGEAALLPGLVNTHAHPELTIFRGILEDRPFPRWIPDLVRLKRGAGLGPEHYVDSALWCCVESLAAGITTIGATEDSGAAQEAFIRAGLRGVVYREVFGPSPANAEAAVAELAANVNAMRAAETDLVRVGVSPHAPYTVSDELYRRVAEMARDETLPVAVHAAESGAETELVRDGDGPFAAGLRARGIPTPPRARSPIALLEQTGVLEQRPLVIHCVRADREDIERLAASGAAVAHCPVANARLGHGTAPVPELMEAGVTVGLGTDSMASNNRTDLLEEARTAQLVQRIRLQSGEVLPPPVLLRMATLDGARALGLDDRIGSLEVGKDADLCAVALDGAHTTPVHEPLAALVHAARAGDVVLTAVRGRILYRSGELATLRIAEARVRMERAAALLRADPVEPL